MIRTKAILKNHLPCFSVFSLSLPSEWMVSDKITRTPTNSIIFWIRSYPRINDANRNKWLDKGYITKPSGFSHYLTNKIWCRFAQIWLYKHSLLCSSPPSLLLISITMGKCSLLFLCVPFLVFAINLILWWWWVVFAFVVLFWAGENSSAFDVRVPVYTSEEVYVLTFLFFELLLLYSVCWRVSNLIVLGFIRIWW